MNCLRGEFSFRENLLIANLLQLVWFKMRVERWLDAGMPWLRATGWQTCLARVLGYYAYLVKVFILLSLRECTEIVCWKQKFVNETIIRDCLNTSGFPRKASNHKRGEHDSRYISWIRIPILYIWRLEGKLAFSDPFYIWRLLIPLFQEISKTWCPITCR
jgi:hypothetical protein